ncbi:MAG: hypothetical protein K0R59_414 [Sphingobacterium sp.]|jgi:hypothetical protein|nr:hypothetical protein [Sphingobacterium sp.]
MYSFNIKICHLEHRCNRSPSDKELYFKEKNEQDIIVDILLGQRGIDILLHDE